MKNTNEAWFSRALSVTPGGVNSPVRAFNGVGGTPLVISGGEGSKVFSSDGKALIDWCCSWGAMILGHANAEIAATVSSRAAKGSSFGIVTEDEIVFAERLCSLVPGMDKVRAVNSGTEAVMTAVRLARGATGREVIVKFDGCYHGHSDSMLVRSGSGILTAGGGEKRSSSAGVPETVASGTVSLPYNDIRSVRAFFAEHAGEVAAVIVEPAAGNMGLVPPKEGFLAGLREITRDSGALLICDEVINGFRFAFSTYSSRFAGIDPDIVTLGKVIGGTLPLAAVGGKAPLMDMLAPAGPVYQAGTLAGNPLAVAAGLKTLEVLERDDPYSHMERLCSRLADGVGSIAADKGLPVHVAHFGGVFTVFCSRDPVSDLASAKTSDTSLYAKMFHSLYRSGIYIAPSQFECNFVSAAHTEADVDAFLDAFSDFAGNV